MDDPPDSDGLSPSIKWESSPPETVSPPIFRTLPYLELKLEHPALEPTGYGERFFPDVVPYKHGDTSRAWYWRPALRPSTGEPSEWELVCATTHELSGITSFPASVPPLVTDGANGTTVVVDGAIGGDLTTSYIRLYTSPNVSVSRRNQSTINLTIAGHEYSIDTGERRHIRLSEQQIEPVEGDEGPTTVVPELVVRYPGQRELHHPARGAAYRLFPSFGLDLGDIPNPVQVPTVAGELDDTALAEELDLDLSSRPYPERVLWQAFAYSTFDPHSDTIPKLTQLETGHIVLRQGAF